MNLFKIFNKRSNKVINDIEKSNNLEQITNILSNNQMISIPKDKNHNTLGEHLDKLIDGDLPFGWASHKADFINPINKEFNFFLNAWIDTRNHSPKEQYSALKSFVLYMEDIEKLCKSKGECYEFWFYEILTGKGYLKKRQKELKELFENLDEKQATYEKKQELLLTLDKDLLEFLQNNDGILQKDIYKSFDLCVKGDIQSQLYYWEKSGKIKREKSGNTYKITL